MNSIKTITLAVATSLLVASCTSYNQAAAGLTGAAIGSHVGRDIGYLAGGGFHRFGGPSSALGSLIGAGIGAALGVGIQNSIERSREKAVAESVHRRGNDMRSDDDYQYEGGSSYERDRHHDERESTAMHTTATANQYVTIEPISYMDGDGDGLISKGEAIEVQTYITNVYGKRLNDVTISLNGDDSKYIAVSSPLFTTLSPGQKIKYTGRVYCQKAKTGVPININVKVSTNDTSITTKDLQVYMK